MLMLASMLMLGSMLMCQAAAAQSNAAPRRSVSYSTWLLEQDTVTVRVALPTAEAASLVGMAIPLLSSENLASYVLGHVSVMSGGAPCAPADQGYDIGRVNSLSLGADLYGLEMVFRCSGPGPMLLHNGVMFAEFPQHIDFARMERGGLRTEQIFTASREELSIPPGTQLPAVAAAAFLMLGSSHLWHSADRLCAILGFFMMARTARRLLVALAALIAGYAASVLLAAVGMVPDLKVLDAGTGFIVTAIAAALAAQALQRMRRDATPVAIAAGGFLSMLSLAAALTHRPHIALVLIGFALIGAAATRAAAVGSLLPVLILPAMNGLLDGFVLPGDYERLQQWGEMSLRNLTAFDGGALMTGALLLAALCGLGALARRARTGAAAARERLAPVGYDLAASGLAGLGSFWLLSRLF
jgi:hypothetical protein